MSNDEYRRKYPDSELISAESRKTYSNKSIEYYEKCDKLAFKKRYENRILTDEQRKNSAIRLTRGRNEKGYDQIYTKERNSIIALKKKQWWNKQSDEYKTNMSISNRKKFRDRVGDEEYFKLYRKLAGLASKSALNMNGRSSLEEYMFNILENSGIRYVEQYEINGYRYDCYLSDYNVLIEFDGDYWHPIELKDGITERQRKQYIIDRYKDKLAMRYGYQILRVRESVKTNIFEILNKIIMEST